MTKKRILMAIFILIEGVIPFSLLLLHEFISLDLPFKLFLGYCVFAIIVGAVYVIRVWVQLFKKRVG